MIIDVLRAAYRELCPTVKSFSKNKSSPAEGDTGKIEIFGYVASVPPPIDEQRNVERWGRPVVYQIVATSEADEGFIFQKDMGIGVVPRTDQEMARLSENNDFIPIPTRFLKKMDEGEHLSKDDLVFAPVLNILKSDILSEWSVKVIQSRKSLSLRAVYSNNMMNTQLYRPVVNHHIRETVQRKWAQPVDSEVLTQANDLLAVLKEVPFPSWEQIDLLDWFRVEGSRTVRRLPKEANVWKAGDLYARSLVLSGESLTKAHLQKLNTLALKGESHGDEQVWQTEDRPALGPDKKYLMGAADIPFMMDELLFFVNDGLERVKSGEENPIVLAALVYQRFLCIHPLKDGNGRTGRLLMDIILMRSGLLPAPLMDEKVNVCIYGDHPGGKRTGQDTTTIAVQFVMEALRFAYEQIATQAACA